VKKGSGIEDVSFFMDETYDGGDGGSGLGDFFDGL